MNASIIRLHDYLERKRLQPDLNRAARCTVAFMGPMLAVHWWHLPIEASFAAIAAQNIAMIDVRGSYPLRLSLLLTTTVMLAGATWLGSMTSASLSLVLAAIALVMVIGGLWRHLSTEYGPSVANASALLFLIALARPGGHTEIHSNFLAALAGGMWGVLIQGSLWPFRAQHPLRRAVADSWLALSDLLAAMTPANGPAADARHQLIAGQLASVRTALDQATAILKAAALHGERPYLKQLEELNLSAARLSTRIMAFNASLETLMERVDLEPLAGSFDPVIAALTNSTRTVALTVVSRQPSHLAACEVRLHRLENLLQAFQDRLLTQTNQSPDGIQFTFILRQIAVLLPAAGRALRATVERADERSAFSLELFDLQTWTLRPLASALNFKWRPDPALVRFIARATVLQLLGVAIFMLLHLERGYWFPLTMLVVLQPEYGATRLRAGQRVIGTLAGSLFASAVLWLSLPPAALMTTMALTIAGFAFWIKRNYAIAVFFITLFVVLITEIHMHVTVAFTLERLAATGAGGMLAMAAALLFWPVWERERFPSLLSQALHANRDYVVLLGNRLATGSGYDAEVIAIKRAAELANSTVFTSLQRMSAEPRNQQARIGVSAILANGNQRLTHALTGIALHLTPDPSAQRPQFLKFIELAAISLESIANSITSAVPASKNLAAIRAKLDQLTLSVPKAPEATPMEHGIYSQFGRCTTELSAMLIAAADQEKVGGNGVSGLPSISS